MPTLRIHTHSQVADANSTHQNLVKSMASTKEKETKDKKTKTQQYV